MLRLALPSKGELEEPTLAFLKACGLSVNRPNSRQYTARVPALHKATVLFQRAADIAAKVEEGSTDVGITGLDTVRELTHDDSNCAVLVEDLDFGQCDLVVAVPETWIDVTSMADLVELSEEMRAKSTELRVATKFPRMTRQYFLSKGLNFFSLVASTGAMEVAPTMGFADIIVDLTSSGATLRENGLRTLSDGTLLRSQACLIGNLRCLRDKPKALEDTKLMLEMMESHLRAEQYYSVTANVQGATSESVAEAVMRQPEVAGIRGPTVSKVYSRHGTEQNWYAVTVVVRKDDLTCAVEHLRTMGGSSVTVYAPKYVFEAESEMYRRLLDALDKVT